MNIFYLHKVPRIAAQYHNDRHVVKMILETAQLLSTAHVEIDGVMVAYKATHVNHPSAIWVRESIHNYNWAYQLLAALLDEYTYRYGKTHATARHLEALSKAPQGIPKVPATPIRLAMPEALKSLYTGVEAYRMYYSLCKRVFADGRPATWTKRPKPEWF